MKTYRFQLWRMSGSHHITEKQRCFMNYRSVFTILLNGGLIEITALRKLLTFLSALEEDALLTNHRDCKIKRTHPAEKTINNIDFLQLTLEYPQLIYKFEQYEIIAEITIREKQRAIGTQPMLYFCIPITEINANENLIGRVAQLREHGEFVFNQKNYK